MCVSLSKKLLIGDVRVSINISHHIALKRSMDGHETIYVQWLFVGWNLQANKRKLLEIDQILQCCIFDGDRPYHGSRFMLFLFNNGRHIALVKQCYHPLEVFSKAT